jgi:hypothetical protein
MDNVQELKGETSSQDLFPPTTCEDVQKVKTPTLLLNGEHSPKIFHLINDMLEHCLPSVERATIPAASHGLDDRFHETSGLGTGDSLTDSSFVSDRRGVAAWQGGGRQSNWQ